MAVRVENDHTQEVLKALKDGIRRSLLESGKLVLTSAQAAVPVDTGKLKRSLYSEMKGDSEVEIGSRNVAYNIYVECGTSKMGAQPYLLPSAVNNEGQIASIFRSNLS